MKILVGISAVAVCCLCLGSCASLEHDYRVIYSAACPVSDDAGLHTRLQALGDGVADRLQIPRPKIYDTTMDSYSVLYPHFAASDRGGAQDIEITFESEHNTVESRSGVGLFGRTDIAVWIQTYPNEENANIRRVRSIIEVELTRVGCGKWDFRHHVKLS